MLLPIVGLLLLENLFRNADRDTRWALKHLCIALGIIYAYDFFYFADSLALGRPSPVLYGARGLVNAMMVPLIALGVVRSRSLASGHPRFPPSDLPLLRPGGIWPLSADHVGGELTISGTWMRAWGPPLQIVFLIGAAVNSCGHSRVGICPRARQALHGRNFFSLKYDYRQTWMQFVQAVSSTNPRASLQRQSPQRGGRA